MSCIIPLNMVDAMNTEQVVNETVTETGVSCLICSIQKNTPLTERRLVIRVEGVLKYPYKVLPHMFETETVSYHTKTLCLECFCFVVTHRSKTRKALQCL